MTEKLYYRNPYKSEFKAQALSSDPENGKYGVVLDRTYFYPEGGGQPPDKGWLNDMRVRDVQLRGDQVVHYVDSPLNDGTVVGKIDWERRFDYMQQHTGQHILSQSLLRVGQYPTKSVHFGEDYTAVEIETNNISEQNIKETERLANQIINENREVKTYWVDAAEVENFDTRRPPPDVKNVRIVEINDFELTACGGTHVKQTGEVGLIKIVGQQKIRGRIRLQAKIGKRAHRDYDSKAKLVQQLMTSLTSSEEEIIDRVIDLQTQLKEKQREVVKLQNQIMGWEAQQATQNAQEIGDYKYIEKVFENVDNKILKTFGDEILSDSNRLVIAISKNDDQIRWICAHTFDRDFDLREFLSSLLPIMGAKGGGNARFMQGGGNKPDDISSFLENFREKLARELKV